MVVKAGDSISPMNLVTSALNFNNKLWLEQVEENYLFFRQTTLTTLPQLCASRAMQSESILQQ